ncbi:MAG TPA: phosphoribosylformylglycinamidine synthase subunit PurQ, partial [Candidatus Polarisedimenticolia bacterium]|nr:phosphoribosylformylglycinamidine synthase subunit PurQ [Candidatus Polarisedimenticolia bacterium]
MKFGIVVFPGSNCEHDCYHVVKHVLRQDASFLWHKDTTLSRSECVILPGGFAHGDYLRCGAMAKFSPIMDSIARFAAEGGPVLGICNGFQILTEAGLLPGALIRNRSLHYLCQDVHVRVDSASSAFTRG